MSNESALARGCWAVPTPWCCCSHAARLICGEACVADSRRPFQGPGRTQPLDVNRHANLTVRRRPPICAQHFLLVLAERLATSRSRGRRFSSSNAHSFFLALAEKFLGGFSTVGLHGFLKVAIISPGLCSRVFPVRTLAHHQPLLPVSLVNGHVYRRASPPAVPTSSRRAGGRRSLVGEEGLGRAESPRCCTTCCALVVNVLSRGRRRAVREQGGRERAAVVKRGVIFRTPLRCRLLLARELLPLRGGALPVNVVSKNTMATG